MSTTAQNSARARILGLLDENSFVEIGGMVTARNTDFNLKQMDTPSDGVITGYGVIGDMLVYVYSQDASVLNGTMGEMHARKIANIYDMAMKMGAPVIGLIDCAGLRLQEATDGLNAFGEVYMKQTLASGVIPQITGIFGSCGGGLSILPAMSDFTFMEENGKLFVNSPNAIDENSKEKCDSASAKFQAEEAGNVDGSGSEGEVLGKIRQLVALLPANNEEDMSYTECTDDLNRACAELANATEDTAVALSMISDNYMLFETKADYGKDMVTAFIRLNGMTVGAVANRTAIYDENGNKTEEFEAVLSPKGCEKAADFVNFCDAFNIPVLTLTNVKGFASCCLCAEKKIAKAAARLTYAFANASVPKVNVVIGKAFGSAYNVMNSKAIGADMVYAWPDAQIGMMDARAAVKIMYAEELKDAEKTAEFLTEKTAEYEALQSSALAAARRGYVDTIIEPADTRKYVIGAFEMLFSKREERPAKKHGTV